jgi:hypothetical protein
MTGLGNVIPQMLTLSLAIYSVPLNPNFGTRNKFEISIPRPKTRNRFSVWAIRIFELGLVSDFVLRTSNFNGANGLPPIHVRIRFLH